MSESRFRISGSGSCEISSCMVCKECSSQPNGGYFCEKLFETDRHYCTLRDYPTFPDNCPLPKSEETMKDKEFGKTKSMIIELLEMLDGAISLDDMAATLVQSENEEGFKAELTRKIDEGLRACHNCVDCGCCIFPEYLDDLQDEHIATGKGVDAKKLNGAMAAVAGICPHWVKS